MRINVYAEELTADTQRVSKTITDAEFGTRTFHGVRLFLQSPDVLNATADDDDRSAITIWMREGDEDYLTLVKVLTEMSVRAREAFRKQ